MFSNCDCHIHVYNWGEWSESLSSVVYVYMVRIFFFFVFHGLVWFGMVCPRSPRMLYSRNCSIAPTKFYRVWILLSVRLKSEFTNERL